MAIKNQIQFRRGSSAEWVAISGGDGPALNYGEPGFDVTNNILKIGDGSTSWKDLKPIGTDQNLYKVKNTSGGIIYKGQVVRANGTVGSSDAIQVTLFIADGSVPEYTIMGLATQDMNNNDFGYVTAFGQIRGIDTDPDNLATNICVAGENWLDGDILYASPTASGKLTKNQPQHDTIIAIILNSADNGSLFVRPTWNPHLNDIHDVNIDNVVDNNLIVYNSGTELWEPTTGLYYVNDKIGLGTSSPIRSIDVVSPSGTSVGIKLNSTGTEGRSFSFFSTNSGSSLGGGKFGIYDDTAQASRIVVDSSGNVGVGTNNPSYKLQINGSFGATTKSFRIDHPSNSNYTLEYGSLESPYHGVRLTGRGSIVKGHGRVVLPYYLKDLIHDDENINIQITNIKHGKTIYVDQIDLNNDHFTVKADRAKSLGQLHFFWTLTGVRKDVDHLIIEREK